MWFFASVLFSLTVTQDPLFTSNQHTYLLHGLARAETGFLADDFLAGTTDPTPLFSVLIATLIRIFPGEIFHGVQFVLASVYFLSISHIVLTYVPRMKKYWFPFWMVLFAMIHSPVLPEILIDGVSGYSILGRYLQPSAFGVLLLLSLSFRCAGHDRIAIATAAAAAWFHPAYMFTSMLLCIGYAISRMSPFRLGDSIRVLIPAIILHSPVLWYSLSVIGSDSEVSRNAIHILVSYRMPHHTMIYVWFGWDTILKVTVMILGLYLIRNSDLITPLAAVATGALTVSLLSILTGSEYMKLLLPWRSSVLLVPLTSALILGHICVFLSRFTGSHERLFRTLVPIAASMVFLIFSCVGAVSMYNTRRLVANSPVSELMAHIERSAEAGDLYLVPPGLRQLRLSAGVPVFVDMKSHPYKASDVLQWYRRLMKCNQYYQSSGSVSCEKLRLLIDEFGITHVVLGGDWSKGRCSYLEERFRNNRFRLYAVADSRRRDGSVSRGSYR